MYIIKELNVFIRDILAIIDGQNTFKKNLQPRDMQHLKIMAILNNQFTLEVASHNSAGMALTLRQ